MEKEFMPPALMATSIFGFVISAVYTWSGAFEQWFSAWGQNVGMSLGFTFCLVFVVMFVASMATMAPKK
jgi:hypothetical protein